MVVLPPKEYNDLHWSHWTKYLLLKSNVLLTMFPNMMNPYPWMRILYMLISYPHQQLPTDRKGFLVLLLKVLERFSKVLTSLVKLSMVLRKSEVSSKVSKDFFTDVKIQPSHRLSVLSEQAPNNFYLINYINFVDLKAYI